MIPGIIKNESDYEAVLARGVHKKALPLIIRIYL